MAVRQTTLNELRYLKRQNLDQEARVLGNYYRDLIRSFGIECNYYKLDLSEFENFKGIVDQNAVLRHAYGYDDNPSYEVSSDMLVYAEAEQDIFQLNKFGLQPQTDVTLYFDSTDFACAMASKVGQLKEYKIDELDIQCEVPDVVSDYIIVGDARHYLSSHTFPYQLGLGYNEYYKCEVLSGHFQAEIPGYEYNKTYTIQCLPYEDTIFGVKFPVNNDLYKSFKYSIETNDNVETLLLLTYTIRKIYKDNGEHINLLTGKLHGGVLFYDINKIGKYIEKIHPMVGDIVSIDFPDENNREKYEITECIDKQLTQDGINPLLHKYIWKCKARRYVNSYDGLPEKAQDDDRLQEMHNMRSIIDERITKEISIYDKLSAGDGSFNGVTEDMVYGGYTGTVTTYDTERDEMHKHERYEYIEDGTGIDIMRFSSGCRLVTTGYDLVFIDSLGNACDITITQRGLPKTGVVFESGQQFIKATDSCLLFKNVSGEIFKIVEDSEVSPEELQIHKSTIFENTIESTESINEQYSNFFVFKNTKTVLYTIENHLFCCLASNNQTVMIV